MIQDKYSALWVSHSSIGDFIKCPRAYYLHNIYRTKDNRKINTVSPALSLGIAVHDTLENLANFKTEIRFNVPLEVAFEENWKKVSGKLGGFKSETEEAEAKERARNMVLRVQKNPGPLAKLTVKLRPHANDMPPNFYLSEADNIILNGKIDWLEYVPENDSIRVIDFKTGKNEESPDSLQLPIYALLLHNLQKRKVSGAAYWYLDKDDKPKDVALPEIDPAKERVLAIAKKIKEAKERGVFECSRKTYGCFACTPFEKIIKGEAEFVGIGGYNQELYLI
ncbi:MAG: hypothetical protein A3A98_00990 [Candidatus Staskawiczbacteria bacterium RIFCSPLOWO2_01_FULL_40_39]|uniref:PD-(D/E)XK endonuclease-like domain-containing protein n=1 Tax=Candidatus Staskawiczbacteria bacterium RIFCSPHIGHO2_01_FULL_39_25 TaxID=1802202 RepID=A0A1G2HPP0_9BACT|nr:MAG: hypothetical protein A2730_00990 [Candidatus Staskawiczbacteria bacterium RIFCSPHIGHO2_01_FULL_39_25]OGZ73306.1 MAG: hypothetical protein A3A98_00990 [Candidatus Staskawiczbacteria bacterium RIFCSPLOWO2_01_FULL_40_39]OGZ75070.1 MAG: hypothetical protein A3I87_01305 [Candidatus Staskawiczbacteria bacterium RIFCSPLOWO2_02_FULL_39_8]